MRLLTFPACACGRGAGASRAAAGPGLRMDRRGSPGGGEPKPDVPAQGPALPAWPAEGEWLCRQAALCQALPRGHPRALAGSRETRMERAPQLPFPPPRGPLSCARDRDPSLDDTCPPCPGSCPGFVHLHGPCVHGQPPLSCALLGHCPWPPSPSTQSCPFCCSCGLSLQLAPSFCIACMPSPGKAVCPFELLSEALPHGTLMGQW